MGAAGLRRPRPGEDHEARTDRVGRAHGAARVGPTREALQHTSLRKRNGSSMTGPGPEGPPSGFCPVSQAEREV